jgi:hypothetical protein
MSGGIEDASKDMAFGVDSTTATVNDTRLGFEFYRVPVLLTSTDIQTSGSTTTYSVVYKTTIPQEISGVISEVGLYPSTRKSINNFDSKFITDFNNFLDWTDNNDLNPSVESTGAKIGDTVLEMSSNSTSANEYTADISLDISGYSNADSIRLSYYKADTNLQSITLKMYSSDTDYYSTTITPASGTGYKITNDILLSTFFSGPAGSPEKSQINKIGIVVTPTSGNSTAVSLDGLRINDEDTFDPIFGLISRSVLGSALTKLNGRQVDVEYKLDLSF